MSFNDFYQEYVENVPTHKELKKKLEKLAQSCFEEVPDLVEIRIRGWTPFWNDGDVCYHTEEVAVFSETSYLDSSYGELVDNYMEERYSDSDEEPKLSKAKKGSAVERVSQLIERQPLVRLIYDTNFMVKILKNDQGKVVISHDDWYDYDYCDY